MPVEVIMPQLGESVVEGTVTKWLKQVDEPVREFEPLVEINTDKVDTEVPSPANGTILARFVDEGQTVRAGTVLALIGEPGEPLPQPEDGEAAPARKREDLGFISPVVAKMAAEHGLDLSQVPGTGQAGRITKKDVLAFLERRPTAAPPAPWEEPGLGELFRPSEEVGAAKPAAAPGTILPLDVVRRSIADHMLRSRHTSAHVTTVMEADLSRVIAHRQAHKEKFQREGVSLTFTAYFGGSCCTAR